MKEEAKRNDYIYDNILVELNCISTTIQSISKLSTIINPVPEDNNDCAPVEEIEFNNFFRHFNDKNRVHNKTISNELNNIFNSFFGRDMEMVSCDDKVEEKVQLYSHIESINDMNGNIACTSNELIHVINSIYNESYLDLCGLRSLQEFKPFNNECSLAEFFKDVPIYLDSYNKYLNDFHELLDKFIHGNYEVIPQPLEGSTATGKT